MNWYTRYPWKALVQLWPPLSCAFGMFQRCRDGAVVRALASHQCVLGLIPGPSIIMWVEFVVGSLPCSERFFSGYSGFPLSSKTNISKFQFDLDYCQALYHEARVIAQALPVFNSKFTFTFYLLHLVACPFVACPGSDFWFVLFFCIANQENPELIWNTEAREKICSVVKQLKDR